MPAPFLCQLNRGLPLAVPVPEQTARPKGKAVTLKSNRIDSRESSANRLEDRIFLLEFNTKGKSSCAVMLLRSLHNLRPSGNFSTSLLFSSLRVKTVQVKDAPPSCQPQVFEGGLTLHFLSLSFASPRLASPCLAGRQAFHCQLRVLR